MAVPTPPACLLTLALFFYCGDHLGRAWCPLCDVVDNADGWQRIFTKYLKS